MTEAFVGLGLIVGLGVLAGIPAGFWLCFKWMGRKFTLIPKGRK